MKIYRKEVVHVYQRTLSGFVFLYNMGDAIFFCTLLSTMVKKHSISILAVCLMYNHYHLILTVDSNNRLESFIQEFSSTFSRNFNKRYGLKGRLFDKYGFAVKRREDKIRSAIAYVYNNPVAAQICGCAEKWRWNFLAYSESKHPFSEKMILSRSRLKFRNSVRIIRYSARISKPLTYKLLENVLEDLSENEKQQLVDFMISEYMPLDLKAVISYFGSYKTMLTALHSFSGNEYDITETLDPVIRSEYNTMARYLKDSSEYDDIGALLNASLKERARFLDELIFHRKVSRYHALKFLHIKE